MIVALITFEPISTNLKLFVDLPKLENISLKLTNHDNYYYVIDDVDRAICLLNSQDNMSTAIDICQLYSKVTIVANGDIVRSSLMNKTQFLNSTDETFYEVFCAELPALLENITIEDDTQNGILIW